MSNKIKEASIEESLGLLNIVNPEALKVLREEFPESQSTLFLGEVAAPRSVDTIKELKMRIKVSKVALIETIKRTKDSYLPVLKSKLQRLQKIEFWTQVIIVISSSAMFTLLIQGLESNKELAYLGAYLSAALSLVGAILTIILKQNTGEWALNNQNIAKSCNDLVDYVITGEEYIQALDIQYKFVSEEAIDEIKTLINNCNALNRKMRGIVDKYPMPKV